MAKRTKKVGISGKFGVRYGSTLRKILKKFEIAQHMRYVNPFNGKVPLLLTQPSLRRSCTGIWKCSASGLTIAGGAWTPTYAEPSNPAPTWPSQPRTLLPDW